MSYEGWRQIDLHSGINVTLQPCHMVSRDVFEISIELTLTKVYAELRWDYSKEEIHNQAVYFTILYKDLYSK